MFQNLNQSLRLKKIISHPLFIVITLFLLSLLIVRPFGEHAVNDDWDFYLHVKYFLSGIFAKNTLIDSMFILQGLIATVWAKIFGLSFLSLRFLTIIFTIIFISGVYKVLALLRVYRKLITFTLLLILFNPIIYLSGLSFMTEIYFLAFAVYSLYFMLSFLKGGGVASKNAIKFLLISSILGAASLLIRQFGVVLLIAYLLILLIQLFELQTKSNNSKSSKNPKKEKIIIIQQLLTVITPFAIAFLAVYLFPQYQKDTASKLIAFANSNFLENAVSYPFILSYFAFFLAPLLALYLKKMPALVIALIAGVALLVFRWFYNLDIFALGNVFYVEGFFKKTDFVHDISLFDNVIFKMGLSYFVAFFTLVLVYFVICESYTGIKSLKIRQFKKPNYETLLLLLLTLGLFFIVFLAQFLTNDFYDRYFINCIVFLIVLVAVLISRMKLNVNWLGVLVLSFFIVFTVFLANDYYQTQKAKWHLAYEVQEEKDLVTGVFVNGSFARFMYTNKFDHPKDLEKSLPSGLNYECFVHDYTKLQSENNLLYKVFNRLENSYKVDQYFKNPQVYDNKTTPGVELVKYHMGDIYYSEAYNSLMYKLVGKQNYVGVYCK